MCCLVCPAPACLRELFFRGPSALTCGGIRSPQICLGKAAPPAWHLQTSFVLAETVSTLPALHKMTSRHPSVCTILPRLSQTHSTRVAQRHILKWTSQSGTVPCCPTGSFSSFSSFTSTPLKLSSWDATQEGLDMLWRDFCCLEHPPMLGTQTSVGYQWSSDPTTDRQLVQWALVPSGFF